MGVGIMARRRLLTEAMWAKIGPLLPEMKSGPKGGRPWRGNREVREGILWVLRTGAAWADLPEEYPSPSTCWRRLRRWEEEGVWLEVWRSFLAQLDQKGTLEWQESFLDASFAPAKGGAMPWAQPSGARARSGWWWSTARVFLWEANLPRRRRRKSPLRKPPSTPSSRQPERVIADKAYDSDPLRQALHERGMELICPHRANRKRAKTQDGRKLRRYRRRWRIERTFAWLATSAAW